MKTNNNVILITGGATGIGFALAKQLSKENTVIICGRREEKLSIAKAQLPNIITKKCDITNANDRKNLIKYIMENFKHLDILINNAGIQKALNFSSLKNNLEIDDTEIDINFKAQVHMVSVCMQTLSKSENAAIINVSSGLAFVPLSEFPIYCATKAALHSFTLSLRHQLRNLNIKVFEVIPPYVYDTDLKGPYNPNEIKPYFGMSSEEFTKIVIEGLKTDRYEIGSGKTDDLSNLVNDNFKKRFDMMNK